MSKALQTALEMERAGDIYGALSVCRTLLRSDKFDSDAKVLFAHLNLNNQLKTGVNMRMMELLMSDGGAQNSELKRWLINGL